VAREKPVADLNAVAKSMVQAAMIKVGDKVLILGSVRDSELLEDLAIETMKAGGQPVITISSVQLERRSYDEVPASYDSQPQTAALAIANTFDVQLSVDVGESENVLAGVPAARVAERDKASSPVEAAALRRNARIVMLGNELYPTKALAERLDRTQAEMAAIFWKASLTSPESIRAKGDALRSAVASPTQLTLTAANRASGGGQDGFSFVDIGLNPAVTLPTSTGRIIYMAAGNVAIGMGDNAGSGVVSDFRISFPVSGATLKAGERVLIDNGTLK
jgi:hypothetical protein